MDRSDALHSRDKETDKQTPTPDSERTVLDPVEGSQGFRRPNMVIVLAASLALALIVAVGLSWYFNF